MIEYHYIEPVELKKHWHIVRDGMGIVCKRVPHIPEEIYMMIAQGAAHLHIITKDGEYYAFTVTQNLQDFGQIRLHIWAAYSNTNEFETVKSIMPQIKEWAKAINASRITFESNRPGWEKRAPELGYKKASTTYEIQL